MADRAVTDYDKDGDGLLSMSELEAAPGLKYAAQQLDADRDGNLGREEIRARLAEYERMQAGLTSFTCTVIMGRRPLAGARVRLVPEPFLEDVLEPVEGTSQADGQAEFNAAGINMSVAPIGMYRVEITSPDRDIPAQYNTDTTLGVEVSASDAAGNTGPPEFRLKQR